MTRVLHIDSSAQTSASVTRRLGAELVERLGAEEVVYRDLTKNKPGFVDEDWVAATFTPPSERSQAMKDRLAESDELVDELMAADIVVIGVPVYNFGVPAVLKAWIDMIGRVGRTFNYTANGPVGLLEGKHAIVVTATGGTPVSSAIDFSTPYMKHVMGFVGITDVSIVAAEKGNEAVAREQMEPILASNNAVKVPAAKAPVSAEA